MLISPTLPAAPNTISDDFVELNGQQVDLIDNLIRFAGPAKLVYAVLILAKSQSVVCGFFTSSVLKYPDKEPIRIHLP